MNSLKNKHIFNLFLPAALAGSLVIAAACTQSKAAGSKADNAAFEYREIYLPETAGKNARKFNLNNLEDDWGIWGHNLAKVLPKSHSHSVFSKKDGVSNEDQFCFMSNRLFEYIEDYVDRYGDDEQVKFAILPNDNGIVCLCEKCVAEGNTKKNASPAVFNMIRRLSERFPNHLFFTSHYRTTRGVPEDTLPANVGVLISAIDYPLSVAPSEKEDKFRNLLSTWSERSNHVYVWDYINNFDDYFTPFPVFEVMQHRLRLYRDAGVEGIFLNGSGPEYSSLSSPKSEVLAALTVDPDMDWKEALRLYCVENYPVAGNAIADFMIAQEDYVVQKGKQLPLYDGVEKALVSYLPEADFLKFYDRLNELLPQTSGKEKEQVTRLCYAMALTALEVKRINGNIRGASQLLKDLSDLKPLGVEFYNESSWSIDNYIRDYNNLINHAQESRDANILKGHSLRALSGLDPDYSDLTVLTDGLLGIPSNYHNGNLINTPDVRFKIGVPEVEGMKKLRLCLVYNPAYRISLPEEIIVTKGEETVGRVNPALLPSKAGHVFVDFDIPHKPGEIVLTLMKNADSHSMALDEIEAFR